MLTVIWGMNPLGIAIVVIILAVFIAAAIGFLKMRRTYARLTEDVLDPDNRRKHAFALDINSHHVEDFKAAADLRISAVNTAAIIEKNLQRDAKGVLRLERFIKKAPGLMIILGLIGTFFGLTLSISELVTLLSATGEAIADDVGVVTLGLLSSIDGMAVAFVTSLFGISASIITNVLGILFGVEDMREGYVSAVEEYLDNTLGLRTTDMTYVDENGKTPLENAFEQLGERLNENMRTITEAMSYRMTVASNNMRDTAEAIDKSLSMFDGSVNRFSENTRELSEFNHHLRSNVQRMSLAFEDFSEHLKADAAEGRSS